MRVKQINTWARCKQGCIELEIILEDGSFVTAYMGESDVETLTRQMQHGIKRAVTAKNSSLGIGSVGFKMSGPKGGANA